MKHLHVSFIALLLSMTTLYAVPLHLSGVVVSDNEKSISSRYMGYVKEVFVDEGSVVKKGELLYSIDSQEIDTAKVQVELSIAQAALNVQMYENQYNHATLNLERHQRLLQKEMVSRHEVENLALAAQNLKSMVEIAKQQQAAAQAKRAEVQNLYAYLDVRAPSDSVVVAKHIKAGEMSLPGVPSMVLSDLQRVKIVTEVSENQLSRLNIGDSVKVIVRALGYETHGRIAAIIPSANVLSHTFKVKVAFDLAPNIYPGMYADLIFHEKQP